MTIEENVSLKNLTTFKLGGDARYFVRVHNLGDLKKACAWASSEGLPIFVLGEGSNVLISDKGFPGLTIKIELEGITHVNEGNKVLVTASAGEPWDGLVAFSVSKGWYGIENLSNIPGTVGATPIQNIGAYGVEIKDVIRWVEVFDVEARTINKIEGRDCNFAYRDSLFKHDEGKDLIVTKVCYELNRNGGINTEYSDVKKYFKDFQIANPTLLQVREAIFSIRKAKFPDIEIIGTGGSFFKNPIISTEHFMKLKVKYPLIPHYVLEDGRVKLPLAWILEHVCLVKGLRKKHVGTFKNQPLVLVHYGGGTSEEIKKFAYDIQNDIKIKTGIAVVPEVSFIGSF